MEKKKKKEKGKRKRIRIRERERERKRKRKRKNKYFLLLRHGDSCGLADKVLFSDQKDFDYKNVVLANNCSYTIVI